MSNFVYIKNNKIEKYEDYLPESWENVSGFHHAKQDDKFINSYGWFRVVKKLVEYDTVKQYISSYIYEIKENYVIEIPIISDLPLSTKEEERKSFLQNVRNRRNSLLLQSDWTQNLDLQKIRSDEWKNAWENYRQNLRDFTIFCESIDPIANIDELPWPITPSS